MRLSFLHVSDIHFGIDDPDGEHQIITDGVISAVNKAELEFDFVVFSGDLTQSASDSEFQQGHDWLSKLSAQAKYGVILCPGNHDVIRGEADKDFLRSASSTEKSFNKQRKKISNDHPHLNSFLSWSTDASKENPAFLNSWSDNPFVDTVSVDVSGFNVQFVCLNSAFLSCDDDDKGSLCLDVKSINSAIFGKDTSKGLVVVVSHHPTSWMVEWNKDKVDQRLGQETGPHLFFHGHLHDTEMSFSSKSSGSSLFISSAGACYQGSKWPQRFTYLELDFEKQEICPSVYKFSPDSGLWLKDEEKSRPVPARLPVSTNIQTKDDVEDTSAPTEIKFKNPFDSVVANSLDSHLIPKLFVDKNNHIHALSNRLDSIVEGQRGTGKTMLLRYLSVEVQSIQYPEKNWKDYLSFFGIYCRLSASGLNRTDYDAVGSKERIESIFSHRLTLYLIAKTLDSTLAIWPKGDAISKNKKSFIKFFKRTLKLDDSFSEFDSWGEFFKSATIECNIQIEEVDEHVASLLPGGNPTVFNPRFGLSTTFINFLKSLRDALGMDIPFFLLLDDFDWLSEVQQRVVFSAASERSHDLVCFKYGIMTFGKKTSMAGPERTYRDGDDYNSIQLSWIDKGLAGGYEETVIEIANKRIEHSKWPGNIFYTDIFSTWKHGEKIRNEVKERAKEEYEKLPKGKKPKTFENFWSKQGYAKYLRHLKNKKIELRYAGPDAIVEISSGIFRQFLEICSRIITSALDQGWKPNYKDEIGHEIQNSAIRQYSEDMMKGIGETSGDTTWLHVGDFKITNTHIHRLAESLSRYFYERLHSDSDDAEVIAVSIKGDFSIPSFGKTVLDVAVRESVLQRKTVDYPSKDGDGQRLSKGVRDINPIPGFNGRQWTNKERMLIAFLGHEGARVHLATRNLEPDGICLIGQSDDQFHGDLQQISDHHASGVIGEYGEKILEKHAIGAYGIDEAYSSLRDIYEKYHDKFNITVLIMGTKLQALGAILFAIKNRDVEIVHASPAIYNTENYSEGVGETIVFDYKTLMCS